MKAFVFASALFLISSSTFAIGRPHNIFSARKAVTVQVASQKNKEVKPEEVLKTVTDKVEKGMEGARQTISLVEKVSSFFMKFID